MLLDVSGHIVIVIIETDLANGHHLGVLCKLPVGFQVFLGHVPGVAGPCAHYGIDKGVLLCNGDGLLRGGNITADVVDEGDPLLVELRQKNVTILVKGFIVIMGVCIIKQVGYLLPGSHCCFFRSSR